MIAENHHSDRFDEVAHSQMPIVSHKILWYSFGMGGRIFDLPPQYQDAVAASVTMAHPRSFYRRALLYCLASGRFRPSTHPRVVGLTIDELRERASAEIHAQRLRNGTARYAGRHEQLAAARAAKAAKRRGVGTNLDM